MKPRGDRSEEYKKRKRCPAYISWANMMARCCNSKHPDARHYSERGITVCERWRGRGGFKNFLSDMGSRPEEKTLDRVRVNEGYSKDNCKWATLSEQNKNRRSWKKVLPSSEEVQAGIEYDLSLEELGINI